MCIFIRVAAKAIKGGCYILKRVVLQKVFEDRKLLGEGIDYAATLKISSISNELYQVFDGFFLGFLNLSFLQYVHSFVAFNCSPCSIE